MPPRSLIYCSQNPGPSNSLAVYTALPVMTTRLHIQGPCLVPDEPQTLTGCWHPSELISLSGSGPENLGNMARLKTQCMHQSAITTHLHALGHVILLIISGL